MPGVNSTSAADMAFTLLLFFLLTTSMDTNWGLSRSLPPPPQADKKDQVDINKRNILLVMVSYDNKIMCGGQEVSLAELKAKTKEFIENPANAENLPEKKLVDIPLLGEQMITSDHLISLQCDRGTNYQVYIDVQNELAAAYNELREEISLRFFNSRYNVLDEDKKKAISEYYKQKISEAEPKSYGDKNTKKR